MTDGWQSKSKLTVRRLRNEVLSPSLNYMTYNFVHYWDVE